MNQVYPLDSFSFNVHIEGDSPSTTSAFSEVSGITMEMDTEEITEGGNADFRHRVPKAATFSNLVLKRGIMSKTSPFTIWCMHALDTNLIKPVNSKLLLVQLLNESGDAIAVWKFTDAWPIMWTIANIDGMKGELMVERLEFSYSFYNRFPATPSGNF